MGEGVGERESMGGCVRVCVAMHCMLQHSSASLTATATIK